MVVVVAAIVVVVVVVVVVVDFVVVLCCHGWLFLVTGQQVLQQERFAACGITNAATAVARTAPATTVTVAKVL